MAARVATAERKRAKATRWRCLHAAVASCARSRAAERNASNRHSAPSAFRAASLSARGRAAAERRASVAAAAARSRHSRKWRRHATLLLSASLAAARWKQAPIHDHNSVGRPEARSRRAAEEAVTIRCEAHSCGVQSGPSGGELPRTDAPSDGVGGGAAARPADSRDSQLHPAPPHRRTLRASTNSGCGGGGALAARRLAPPAPHRERTLSATVGADARILGPRPAMPPHERAPSGGALCLRMLGRGLRCDGSPRAEDGAAHLEHTERRRGRGGGGVSAVSRTAF